MKGDGGGTSQGSLTSSYFLLLLLLDGDQGADVSARLREGLALREVRQVVVEDADQIDSRQQYEVSCKLPPHNVRGRVPSDGRCHDEVKCAEKETEGGCYTQWERDHEVCQEDDKHGEVNLQRVGGRGRGVRREGGGGEGGGLAWSEARWCTASAK